MHPESQSEQATVKPGELSTAQSWLERAAPLLFPPACAVVVQRYDMSSPDFPLIDDPAILRATEKRQREFSAGRAAAQTALRKLGLPSMEIPLGPNRNPLWPAGIVGSITHTAGLAVAVIGRSNEISGLGIDLEFSDAVKSELWATLFTLGEIKWIRAQPMSMQTGLATILFGAKESFYKFQYPRTGLWIDFHEAEITVSPETETFRLACMQNKANCILGESEFSGAYAVGHGFTLVAMHSVQKDASSH